MLFVHTRFYSIDLNHMILDDLRVIELSADKFILLFTAVY